MSEYVLILKAEHWINDKIYKFSHKAAMQYKEDDTGPIAEAIEDWTKISSIRTYLLFVIQDHHYEDDYP